MPTASNPKSTRGRHKPVHPGEILWFEFLEPLGITTPRLAKETGMTADRARRLVKGASTVNADVALRLARYFGTTPAFWMNLQSRYELDKAEQGYGKKIQRQVQRFKAA